MYTSWLQFPVFLSTTDRIMNLSLSLSLSSDNTLLFIQYFSLFLSFFFLSVSAVDFYLFFFSFLRFIFFHHIYPTPPLGQDMTQGQFLSGGFNSEFSFS